jgi:hypothetical protein
VFVVGEPPRLGNGKIDYPALVRAAGSTSQSGPHSEPWSGPAGRSDDPPGRSGHAGTDELRALYTLILGRSDVTDDSTFVGLDGDSLSYVEMSIRLEEALGTLPPDWHTTPIRNLAPDPRRSAWKRVDTGVMIRAAAIVAIVGTHAQLFTVLGGAHALLAVAGFNFGRFRLTSSRRPDRIRGLLTSVARIAVPSMVWIGAAAALSDDYTLANALLLNGVLGPDRWTTQWHFWFIEVIVYVLVALTLVLAVPAVDRLERRWPFRFTLAFVAIGLLIRVLLDGGDGPRLGMAPVIFWLFAVGWAAAKATGMPSRLLVSVVVAATVPGFFDNPARDAVVIAAILLLVWVPTVPIPAPLVRLSGLLAASSLYIYLTHWQVYARLDDYSPLLAVISSVVVGIGYGTIVTAVLRRWSHRRNAMVPLGEAAILGGGRSQAGDKLGP